MQEEKQWKILKICSSVTVLYTEFKGIIIINEKLNCSFSLLTLPLEKLGHSLLFVSEKLTQRLVRWIDFHFKHRDGRTARGSNEGTALSSVSPSQNALWFMEAVGEHKQDWIPSGPTSFQVRLTTELYIFRRVTLFHPQSS